MRQEHGHLHGVPAEHHVARKSRTVDLIELPVAEAKQAVEVPLKVPRVLVVRVVAVQAHWVGHASTARVPARDAHASGIDLALQVEAH
eukprot:12849525-Alexandrium_andersonii.AAC.1